MKAVIANALKFMGARPASGAAIDERSQASQLSALGSRP
jgi:hypothetical protein